MANRTPTYRPDVHATADGKAAVYIGAAYANLHIGAAMSLRDKLTTVINDLLANTEFVTVYKSAALGKTEAPTDAINEAPERFDEQIRQWREGIRDCPPMPELGEQRRAELERRAMRAMRSESPAAAADAVQYTLQRMLDDPRLAYLMGPGSECFARLTLAQAEIEGRDVSEFRSTFAASLKYQSVPARQES